MNQFSEGITAEQIQRLVGTSPLMLEIGCHDGSDTIKFLEVMPNARIWCFDPETRATDRFQEKLGNDSRVTLCKYAIADIDGKRQFYASTGKAGRMEDWDYSGSLCKPTGHYTRSPEIKFKEPIKVLCTKLDTLYEMSSLFGQVIDFVWADVQGSQRLLIEGGKRTFCQIKWLYIEAHNPPAYAGEPTQQELINELAEWFKPLNFYAENILFENWNQP